MTTVKSEMRTRESWYIDNEKFFEKLGGFFLISTFFLSFKEEKQDIYLGK